MDNNLHYKLYDYKPPKKLRSKKPWIVGLITILCVVLIVGGVYWFFIKADPKSQPDVQPAQAQQPSELKQELAEQTVMIPDLQPTIDNWVKNNRGTYSIVILDIDGQLIASSNPQQSMFTASIYKLFVAYVGYQKIADGTFKANEPYLPGYTRIQCLDAMIRSSYSPCAEKMLVELGKVSITQKMKQYGLENTSLVGLNSTAEDSAKILQRLQTGKDLTKEHRAAFLDSMKTQENKFRRGLPAGITNATVYNKVGWLDTTIWHDAAIVQTKDGKTLFVAVFTQNVGYKNVAGFGAALEKALK